MDFSHGSTNSSTRNLIRQLSMVLTITTCINLTIGLANAWCVIVDQVDRIKFTDAV